jgi:Holliday junction resolvase RusA-like endonuclease
MFENMKEWRFVVPGEPIPKPRMTAADRGSNRRGKGRGYHRMRPVVQRYVNWCRVAELAAPKDLPASPLTLSITAYLPIPQSWSKKRQRECAGQPHRVKPDADNLLKACSDALWKQDSRIYHMSGTKLYDDGQGPRLVVVVEA